MGSEDRWRSSSRSSADHGGPSSSEDGPPWSRSARVGARHGAVTAPMLASFASVNYAARPSGAPALPSAMIDTPQIGMLKKGFQAELVHRVGRPCGVGPAGSRGRPRGPTPPTSSSRSRSSGAPTNTSFLPAAPPRPPAAVPMPAAWPEHVVHVVADEEEVDLVPLANRVPQEYAGRRSWSDQVVVVRRARDLLRPSLLALDGQVEAPADGLRVLEASGSMISSSSVKSLKIASSTVPGPWPGCVEEACGRHRRRCTWNVRRTRVSRTQCRGPAVSGSRFVARSRRAWPFRRRSRGRGCLASVCSDVEAG